LQNWNVVDAPVNPAQAATVAAVATCGLYSPPAFGVSAYGMNGS
jgi:hypothetical protein